MKTKWNPRVLSSLAMVLIACASLTANAGDLEPVGPPAPTMKTLVEVEPRQTISNADMPLTITQPGSFYLTENLIAIGFGETAITIATSGVTIDLNGFSISGTEVGIWDHGISVIGQIESVVVKNGTVRDCADVGVNLNPSIFETDASNSRVENVHAVANNGDGIRVSENSLILNSVARNNGADGFQLHGARIEGSSAWDNLSSGILASNRSVVDRCTASGNLGGIFVASSTVKNSTATDNTIGIQAGIGKSSIVGNEAHGNTSHGIHVQGANGEHVRIDGNDTTGNGSYGIRVDGTGHIIVRNMSSNNGIDNYNIAAGNAVGSILDVAGAEITTTNPWRNLEY